MAVDAFSGVMVERPLAQYGVFQQPQHIERKEDPQSVVSKPITQATDTFQMENNATPKKRKGFIDGISDITKFFVSLGEMTKATLKAIGGGLITAGATLATFWTFETLPYAFKTGKSALKEAVKHPIKNVSKKGKVAAGILAAGVATYNIIKGIIKMNQRTANVDHSLKTGHRDV